MNKIFLQILMLIFCICTGCHDDSTIVPMSPFEIPSYCNPAIDEEKVVIIDNETGFRQVFASTPMVKPIDFRCMNLLLVKDTAPQGIESIEKQLVKTGSHYELNIIVRLTAAAVMEPWCIAYTVPKEMDKEDVQLTVDYK